MPCEASKTSKAYHVIRLARAVRGPVHGAAAIVRYDRRIGDESGVEGQSVVLRTHSQRAVSAQVKGLQ